MAEAQLKKITNISLTFDDGTTKMESIDEEDGIIVVIQSERLNQAFLAGHCGDIQKNGGGLAKLLAKVLQGLATAASLGRQDSGHTIGLN